MEWGARVEGEVNVTKRGGGGGGLQWFLTHAKKPSAATFHVLFHTSLLDRRGDLSYCIIILTVYVQYSNQCPVATLKSGTLMFISTLLHHIWL